MEKLQFITQDHAKHSHVSQVKKACANGVKWIQYRRKNVSEEKIIEEGKQIAEICKSQGATFILNDYLHLVNKIEADGVHLGLNDISTKEAREVLGPDAIVGGTANTIHDILLHIKNGVSYVGVGPFKHTTTKKVLSPILGFDGYKLIAMYLKENKVDVPVVAIGGIEIPDFMPLFKVGVDSFAVSGLIANNLNSKQIQKVVKCVEQLEGGYSSSIWNQLRAGQQGLLYEVEMRDDNEYPKRIFSEEGKKSIFPFPSRDMYEYGGGQSEYEKELEKKTGHKIELVPGF